MGNEIKRPRGTLDYFGKDEELKNALRNILLSEASLYGADEMSVPMFEESRLFHRTAGESSDIVTKETFDLEKKGDKNYTLRPEFTASINRAILENKLYTSPDLPLRVSYFGPVFRYDRPQAGRLREFHQFGIEFVDNVIDIASTLDALLLSLRACQKALGKDILIKLNFLGSFASRENYKKALYEYFKPKIDSMCDDCKRRLELNPLRILDCKVEADQEICKNAPKIVDYLTQEDKTEFDKIIAVLDEIGTSYQIDDGLVRGLDYYTGLVWELYDGSNTSIGAIGGGGKYSNLMKQIGGPDFEGIGFSLGVERLMLCLSEGQKQKLLKAKVTDVFIIDMIKDGKILRIAEKLRSSGLKVTLASYSKGLGGAFKMADRLFAKYVILNDQDGLKLKNMQTREQIDMNEEEIFNLLKR